MPRGKSTFLCVSKGREVLLVAFKLLEIHWAALFFAFLLMCIFFLPKKIVVILKISTMIIYFVLELRYLLASLCGRVINEEGAKTPKLVPRNQVWHKMTLSVNVDKNGSAALVLQKAVESFKLMDPEIQGVQRSHLLYPALQSEVQLLPGSCEGVH